MTIQQEQIRNVAKMFEAFATAIARKESIEIEYLDREGEIQYFTIDKGATRMISFSIVLTGDVYISTESGSIFFNQKVIDIQSITTYRKIELEFSETNKK